MHKPPGYNLSKAARNRYNDLEKTLNFTESQLRKSQLMDTAIEKSDLATRLRNDRDARAIPHLEQYAPVWIIDEQIIDKDEALQFHVVFFRHLYGWVNRRYRYDGFANVLYHKGQKTISEDEAVQIQEQEPYINPTVADLPNAYGG
jgi:hypothetical protein